MNIESARLLVVDDIAEARYAKVRALQKAGWSVSETSGGEETLAFVASRPTDLVVLDTMLPDILGTEVCREIKRKRPDIMVLQTSATFIGPDAKVTALDAGADAYLVEPAEAPVLVATVRALLRAKSAEDRLRVANESLLARTLELEALLCSAPIGLAFFDKAGRCTRINDEIASVSALTAKGQIGRTFKEIFPNSASSLEMLLGEVFSTGTASRNIELSEGSSAASRHWLTGFFPVRDASGDITAAGCWAVDISDRKRAEEHKELLIHELDHRVKNTLTVVQSLASQTFRGASVDAKVEAFENRLCALSAAHDVLTRGSWRAADLRELVVKAAELHGASDRFSVEGPDLKLKPKAALALAMGLHELCTNALKYGALLSSEGRVNVCWSIEGETGPPRLRLIWKETGGPRVEAPVDRGFGSKLLEKSLASDLKGTISLDFSPDGVTCAMSAPIAVCE